MTNKTAMVFGGARGIGSAIVKRLGENGFDVAFTYVSQPDRASEVVAAVEATGRRAIALKADSADGAAIQKAVESAADQLGPLDAVVVNAGVLRLGTIDTFSLEDLDLSLAVNVRGVFLAIQSSSRHLRDGGKIVTIGSNIAERPGSPGSSVYSMTKAAVAAMVKGVALDLAPRRITVNNVQPGPIETDMTASFADHLRDAMPIGRLGKPEEIAALVSYLVGPETGYMTGSNITIDGGFIL